MPADDGAKPVGSGRKLIPHRRLLAQLSVIAIAQDDVEENAAILHPYFTPGSIPSCFAADSIRRSDNAIA
jgi:hypothetical protein